MSTGRRSGRPRAASAGPAVATSRSLRGRGSSSSSINASSTRTSSRANSLSAFSSRGVRGSTSGNANSYRGRARGSTGRSRPSNSTSRAGGILRNHGRANADQSQPQSTEGMAPEARFKLLRQRREEERANAIANGLMEDPNIPRSLSEAITLVGTCQDMCPEFERVTRIVQGDVWRPEFDPSTLDSGHGNEKPDESRMVKKFRRPAAGIEAQLPSDLRPPKALERTLDYLIDDIIGDAETLDSVHHFLWDRTRSIRNDFSVQQLRDTPQLRIAISCFERIVRFHLLTRHQVGGHLRERTNTYDHQQDLEQCIKTLVSLMAYYDTVRDRYRSPNEAEFRAYWIITRIPEKKEADVEGRIQGWPKEVLEHPRVKLAREIYTTACNAQNTRTYSQGIAQQTFMNFWSLVESPQTSYLMACAAEIFFDIIRKPALYSITQAYNRGHGRQVDEWTLDQLMEPLGLDTEEEVQEYVEAHGFDIVEGENGQWYLDISNAQSRPFHEIENIKPPRIQFFSSSLVESKRHGRTFPAIINGLTLSEAQERGQIDESLFVSDDEKENGIENDEEVMNSNDEEHESDTPIPLSIPFPSFNPAATEFKPINSTTSTTQSTNLGKSLFDRIEYSTQPSFLNSPPTTIQPEASPFASAGASAFKSSPFNMSFTQSTSAQHSSLPAFTSLVPTTSAESATATKLSSSPFLFSAPEKPTEGTVARKPDTPAFTWTKTTAAQGSQSSATATNIEPTFSWNKSDQMVSKTTPRSFQEPVATQPPSFVFPKPETSSTPVSNATPRNDVAGEASFSFIRPKSSTSFANSPALQPEGSKPSSTFSWTKSSSAADQIASATVQEAAPTSTSNSPPSFAKPEPRFVKTSTSESATKSGSSVIDLAPSNAPLATFTPTGGNPQMAVMSQPKPSARAKRKENCLNYIATQMLMDPTNGFLKQYIEYIGKPMYDDARKHYEEDLAKQEAKNFRWNVLALRYFRIWRSTASLLRRRRQGRERRARLAAAKAANAKAKAENGHKRLLDYASQMSDYDKITRDAERVLRLSGGSSVEEEDSIATRDKGKQSIYKPAGSKSVIGPPRSHPQSSLPRSSTGQVDLNGSSRRRTLQTEKEEAEALLRASFLSGEPLRNGHETGKISTVKSNYFKLKSMGLQYLTEDSVKRDKRKREGMSDITPSGSFYKSRSPLHQAEDHPPTLGKKPNLLETRSPLRHSPEISPVLKRKTREEVVAEDEALFARAKAVMKAFDEGTAFYREETRKIEEELVRSQESSRRSSLQFGSSGYDNHRGIPGIPQDASFMAALSQQSSPTPSAHERLLERSHGKLPNYWYRESKFVPRSEYGLGPRTKRAKVDAADLVMPSVPQAKGLTATDPRSPVASSFASSRNGHLERPFDGFQDAQPRDFQPNVNFAPPDDEEEDSVDATDEEGGQNAEEETEAEETPEEDEYGDDDEGRDGYGSYDESDDDSSDHHVPPSHLRGGNSVDDAIEL